MDNTLVKEVLANAALEASAASDYNTNREPSMRASRAGLPLLQLVMEDFILPKLDGCGSNYTPDPYVGAMRIATGYLFEQVVAAGLVNDYPEENGWRLLKQIDLELKSPLSAEVISGHADNVLVNDITKQAIVIECKALKAYSVEEVRYDKCLTDRWGYLTQLVVYTEAVKRMYPTYAVKGIWYVWIKQLEKHTKILLPFTRSDTNAFLVDVFTKADDYKYVKTAIAEQADPSKLAQFVLDNSNDLPLKDKSGGYWRGTCGLHFNNYCNLLIYPDGSARDDADEHLTRMIEACYGSTQAKENLQTLLKRI